MTIYIKSGHLDRLITIRQESSPVPGLRDFLLLKITSKKKHG